MTQDKITFRVEFDLSKFNNDVGQIKKALGSLGAESVKLTTSLDDVEKKTISNAVRFQTLTQGAINLTTAFTQTATSVSNLQKAKTSLQAAAVGVERAFDLQRRKQFQLNQELAKAAPNYQKIELLTRELETAHDDLAVKQQRVKDATDQVSDTYVLFAINIANVSFSAIQTGVSMIQMAKGMKTAEIAGKLLNGTMGKWALIATAIIVAYEGIVQAIGVSNKAFKEQFSIIENINRIMGEWGSATDITLDNYESKINSVNNSTAEFENQWKSMTSTVSKETNEQNRLVLAWKTNYQKALNDIKYGLNELPSLKGGTQGNFSQAQKGVSIPGNAAYAVKGIGVTADIYKKLETIFDFLVPNVQMAQAEKILESRNLTNDDNVAKISPLLKNRSTTQYYGFPLTIKDIDLYTKSRSSITSPDLSYHTSLQTSMTEGIGGVSFLELNSGMSIDAIRLNKLKERHVKIISDIQKGAVTLQKIKDQQATSPDPSMYDAQILFETRLLGRLSNQQADLEYEMGSLEIDLAEKEYKAYKYMGLEAPHTELLSAIEISKKKHRETKAARDKLKISEFIYKGDVTPSWQNISGGWQLKESVGRKIFYAGIGGKLIAEGIFNEAFFGMGTAGMGQSIVNTPMMRDLERAQLQAMGVANLDPGRRRMGADRPRHRTNVDVQAMFNPNLYRVRTAVANTSTGYGGLSQKQIKAGATWEDSGFYASSSGGQVTPQWVKNKIKIRDANNRKLMYGGTLVEGADINTDPNAVIGGYNSKREMLDAWERESRIKRIQISQFFSDYFAQSNKSSRRERGAIIDQVGEMDFIMSLIASTGQSLVSGQKFDVRSKGFMPQWMIEERERFAIINKETVRRAHNIDLLQQGFGIFSMYGSTDSAAVLAEINRQDSLIKSIGLDRIQAFQIIDTTGRGRNEIDDRIRWTQRLEQISTGATMF